jgi:hypothetical protein
LTFPIFADHAPVGKSTDVVVPGILVGNIARGADAMRCGGNQPGSANEVTPLASSSSGE